MKINEESLLQTYLDDIGHMPLLTDDEEQQLAARIAGGDTDAQGELVSRNLRYVFSVATQCTNRGLSIEDLVSEGNVGMMQAAAKFRAGRGKRFVTFAAPYVRKRIEEAIDQQSGLYKIPRGEASPAERKRREPLPLEAPLPVGSQSTFRLLSVVENADAPKADSQVDQQTLTDDIVTAMHVLDERERQVVAAFYGIGQPHQTMAETAQLMGIKRERVRQIRDKALRKLRREARRTRVGE